jgi:hypothetical protein
LLTVSLVLSMRSLSTVASADTPTIVWFPHDGVRPAG